MISFQRVPVQVTDEERNQIKDFLFDHLRHLKMLPLEMSMSDDDDFDEPSNGHQRFDYDQMLSALSAEDLQALNVVYSRVIDH